MISIKNVVNVSLSSVSASLSEYNVGNLMIVTGETPTILNPKDIMVYADSESVASDFGAGSEVSKQADIVFAQTPNILASGGRLLVGRPKQVSATSGFEALTGEISLDALKVISDGCLDISIDGDTPVQLENLDFSSVESIEDVYSILDTAITTNTSGCTVAIKEGIFVITSSSTGASSSIVLSAGTGTGTDISTALDIAQDQQVSGEDQRDETPSETFLRLFGSTYFGGMIYLPAITNSDFKALATTVQTKNCMLFKAVSSIADVTSLGFDIKNLGLTHTRILYSSIPAQAGTPALQDLASAYASLLLATNYRGSSTAKTMHLKTLSGVEADDSISDTTLATLTSCGVDSYLYVAGLPKVWTTSANTYSDEILNLIWLTNSIEVAGFNCLSQTGTKIPQTEYGMSLLRSAYDTVCQQAIINGVAGAGSWNISQTFGDPSVFKSSIASYGYYIYSAPISSQSVADRESRKAPLIQIAVKLTGAIHSTDVMILVNR